MWQYVTSRTFSVGPIGQSAIKGPNPTKLRPNEDLRSCITFWGKSENISIETQEESKHLKGYLWPPWMTSKCPSPTTIRWFLSDCQALPLLAISLQGSLLVMKTKDKHRQEQVLIIGPESDHWECLSVTHWLTNCCLVNLIDVTLACEDANSKLVEVVTVADVDNEDGVGYNLLQIWSWGLDIKLNLCSDFEHKVWSRFWSWSSWKIWSWSLFSILLLMCCTGNEIESWSRF